MLGVLQAGSSRGNDGAPSRARAREGPPPAQNRVGLLLGLQSRVRAIAPVTTANHVLAAVRRPGAPCAQTDSRRGGCLPLLRPIDWYVCRGRSQGLGVSVNGLWVHGALAGHVSATLREAVARSYGPASVSNQGRLSELALHYYHVQHDRGETGNVVNVDIDLVSRRWISKRIEYMAWEFKPTWAGRVTAGQQSVLNETAAAIHLGVEAGLYEERWSGVWLAVMPGRGDPVEQGYISRVIPPRIEDYREDRPTVISTPVPLRLVDLMAILKHAARPISLLEEVKRQPPVLIAELMRQPR